ncbi:uncharacterized protein LOC113289754 isoform X2 [Papaver somniferum]|uniref:uncharacterized protein LOC113289754 isoform X2 n=1 Tax=Papaver somniferum TaxID=3469 RepID=UPI000E6F8704|nr:uncharacterized protein LOC113289754 isoform X2 [Papaver somniferum]
MEKACIWRLAFMTGPGFGGAAGGLKGEMPINTHYTDSKEIRRIQGRKIGFFFSGAAMTFYREDESRPLGEYMYGPQYQEIQELNRLRFIVAAELLYNPTFQALHICWQVAVMHHSSLGMRLLAARRPGNKYHLLHGDTHQICFLYSIFYFYLPTVLRNLNFPLL